VTGVYDVLIVGGGPAGLSAALLLGRCRRRVLVFDSERYRNARTHGVHGFLSRDGIKPAELLSIARRELETYQVEVRRSTVVDVQRTARGHRVTLNDGSKVEGRRILLATGMQDPLPKVEGIDEFYGVSVHHCPYCDGWEHRDEPLAAYGLRRSAFGLALSLKTWSPDVVLLTDGPARFSQEELQTLETLQIPLFTGRIAKLEGAGRQLERIVFRKGQTLDRRAVFFNTKPRQSCDIGSLLHCEFSEKGAIKTDRWERTCVPGVYAAGDCSRNVQWVAVAVSQGAIAAEKINIELQEEDRTRILESAKRIRRR
jgi:thioredoxin reductase